MRLRIRILNAPGFCTTGGCGGGDGNSVAASPEGARLSLEGQGAEVVELAVDLPDIRSATRQIWGKALAGRWMRSAAQKHLGWWIRGLRMWRRSVRGASGVEVMRAEAMLVKLAHVLVGPGGGWVLWPAVPHYCTLGDDVEQRGRSRWHYLAGLGTGRFVQSDTRASRFPVWHRGRMRRELADFQLRVRGAITG